MKDLLWWKGANLAEMTNIGIPVPQWCTITTKACGVFFESGNMLPKSLENDIFKEIKHLEKMTGKEFWSTKNPLLFSIRSGAAISMPGMMDTILNVGLNDETVLALIENTQNPFFAYDSYRRLIQMFGDIVFEIPREKFENIFQKTKEKYGVKEDTKIPVEGLQEVIQQYKELFIQHTGKPFIQDVYEQILTSIASIFKSWNNKRAVAYRKMQNITGLFGTAVNIQSMVYGNMGDESATGVCFTRCPSNGEKYLVGEYLQNAQGEDVVAGIRTPKPISQLKNDFPQAYQKLEEIGEILEQHYKDMQDIEFTIEKGKLYILQTRNAKRTAQAALKIAIDMEKNGEISDKQALLRVTPEQTAELLYKKICPDAVKNATILATGIPAGPWAATGKIVFHSEEACKLAQKWEAVILVRRETSPDDIEGMNAAKGIITSTGGMTSHAAVVARGMGKCCIVGCGSLDIDYENETITIDKNIFLKKWDIVTLSGNTGNMYEWALKMKDADIGEDFQTLMQWAKKYKRMTVKANADTPKDAQQALDFWAEGIGLCRTEHMFFGKERIPKVQEMILAESKENRVKALNALEILQQEDFQGLFEIMQGKNVTIRLIDPPLHEFLPTDETEIETIAKDLNISKNILEHRIEKLQEVNPMLGHRGCRLSIHYPEIAIMQTRAIIKAALNVQQQGKKVFPEIMIPFIGRESEFVFLKNIIQEEAKKCMQEAGLEISYKIGTMIEIPRAVLTAWEIAKEADFFSIGSNDLTQMTLGLSRDDAAWVIADYKAKQIFTDDPFQTIDQKWVGKLIEMTVSEGKTQKLDLPICICGEHGGDPKSINFCDQTGLDAISCSPFRIPVAMVAAAHANLKHQKSTL